MSILFCTFATDKEVIHSELTFHVEHPKAFFQTENKDTCEAASEHITEVTNNVKNQETMTNVKKAYLIMQVLKRQAKEALPQVREHLGKGTWENLLLQTEASPLWVESTKEAAIRECRDNNRESKATIQFYIELLQY